MELGVVSSRVSTIAASAVAVLALAAFVLVAFAAFPLTLAFWRGRVEGAIGLKVVPVLVVERAPSLFGRVASGSAAVGAVRGNVANFTAGIAGLVSWRPTRARTSARRRVGMRIRGTVRGTSCRVSRGRFAHGGKHFGTLPCFFCFPLFRLGTRRCSVGIRRTSGSRYRTVDRLEVCLLE
jgi:hypothetical protein